MPEKVFMKKQNGFSLVELMVVMSTISVLAVIGLSLGLRSLERAQVARTVEDLETLAKGFRYYAAFNDTGPNDGFPDDTNLVLPPGVSEYVPEDTFLGETPLGGRYNWEGPDFYPYAGLAIQTPTKGDAAMLQLDKAMDDGSLATGRFQKTPNGRYTYILWTP